MWWAALVQCDHHIQGSSTGSPSLNFFSVFIRSLFAQCACLLQLIAQNAKSWLQLVLQHTCLLQFLAQNAKYLLQLSLNSPLLFRSPLPCLRCGPPWCSSVMTTWKWSKKGLTMTVRNSDSEIKVRNCESENESQELWKWKWKLCTVKVKIWNCESES